MESPETSIGADIDAALDPALDPELDADAAERELAALTYASVRAAAVHRSPAVEALLGELDRLNRQRSARVGVPRAHEADADAVAPEEIDAMSDELLMRQACYRAAIEAITEPVTPSLAAFLA